MSRTRKLLASLTVVAALASTGAAVADHDGMGSISGRVTNELGDPIEGVCVEAFEYYGEGDYGWWSDGTTDADGSYSIHYLYASEYIVRFTDCNEPRVYKAEWYDDAPTAYEAQPVSVTDAEDTMGIDAALGVGGSISGTVLDETSGEPVPFLCVTAERDDGEGYGHGYTNEDGTYSVGGLANGAYRVHFGECGPIFVPVPEPIPVRQASSSPPPGGGDYVTEWYDDKQYYEDANLVAVVEGIDTPGIDAALLQGGRITGTVTDEDGVPLDGICVDAWSADGGYGFSEAWGGSYEIRGLRSGTYTVQFYDCWDGLRESEFYNDKQSYAQADPVEVAIGVETPGIDAALGLRPLPDLAVTDLTIVNTPLQTDDVTLGHTGWQRTVTVDVANLGNAEVSDGYLQVWIRMVGDGSAHQIGHLDLYGLQPDEAVSRTFDWNGFGTVGDAEVFATTCSYDLEQRYSNNEMSARHYVIAGGTGFGFSLRRDGYFFPCEDVFYED